MTDSSQQPAVAPSTNRADIVRLLVAIAVVIALADVLNGFPVLIVVLALVMMVMLHEFGHFITAKLSGMKVTEYFFGFGPRLWSIRRGETEYGIKMIPAGGYVRIVGMTSAEQIDPVDEPRSYRQATFPRRILVAVAGSTMHVVMAFVLLWAMFTFAGDPVATSAEVQSLTPFVGEHSPAQLAGVRVGDQFVAVNGHHFTNPQDLVNYIEARPGKLLDLELVRRHHDLTIKVRPQLRSTIKVRTNGVVAPLASTSARASGAIGVQIDYLTKDETTNPAVGVQRAGAMLVTVTGETFAGIGQVFSIHGLSAFFHSVETANHHASASAGSTSASSSNSGQLLSIYGAVELGAQAARTDIPLLLILLVAINMFVGIINLFPMLPLDGGHVVVAIYERLRSRRGRTYHADVTKLTPIIYLFVAFILVIGLSALYANIVQPISLPGR